MAKLEIAEKINKLLSKNLAWDEPKLVYLFVQVRKLLDHRKIYSGSDLPHLRFYCDWVVHISKDRIDTTTLQILERIQTGIISEIDNSYLNLGREVIEYAYFNSLKDELLKFLKAENIQTEMLNSSNHWVSFISVLVKVLENQPLVINGKYRLNLRDLTYLPAAERCVIIRINFVKPVTDRSGLTYGFYDYKNAY